MKVLALPVGQLETNCYLLCDTEARVCAVIDPGADAEIILDAARQQGCRVTAVLLTHGHDDHVGGVEGIRSACPGIPVYLNARDAARQEPKLARLFPPVADTVSYDEGDLLAVGSIPVQVLATPGHTEGSVTLQAGELLFCGDTLFAGSCGRTDFPGGNTEAMMASLRRLARIPGDRRVLPGHGGASTLERERQANQYMAYALRSER